jgi:hypothetical protein
MDWPLELERELARGEIPRATQNDACAVHAPRRRFGWGEETVPGTGSLTSQMIKCNLWRVID